MDYFSSFRDSSEPEVFSHGTPTQEFIARHATPATHKKWEFMIAGAQKAAIRRLYPSTDPGRMTPEALQDYQQRFVVSLLYPARIRIGKYQSSFGVHVLHHYPDYNSRSHDVRVLGDLGTPVAYFTLLFDVVGRRIFEIVPMPFSPAD